MFTTNHFIYLALCYGYVIIMTIVAAKRKFSFVTAARFALVVTLCSETSKIISHMIPVDAGDPSQGMVLDPIALPLHLCSILVFAFFYFPFAKEGKFLEMLKSFFVPVGLIGATLANIIPIDGVAFNEPEPWQGFIYHSTMTWFAIYLIRTGQVNLGKKAWTRNLGIIFALSILMIWVNSALQVYDVNFFFIVRPPLPGLPILNLDHGWYVYYLTLAIVAFVAITLVHLPFMIKEHRHS